MNLEHMNWKSFETSDPDIALLPTGSTEQHGPHAPFSTDTVIAENIAQKAGEKAGVLVLPTINIGISEEHSTFPGTLSLKPDTFRDVLHDVIESIADHGVNTVIIVNGHGGNKGAIDEICQEYHDTNVDVLSWTWWHTVNGMDHAGERETSLLLHLDQDLIDMDQAEQGADSWGITHKGVQIDHNVRQFTANGVVGAPRHASAERGTTLFETTVSTLTSLINDIKAGEFPYREDTDEE